MKKSSRLFCVILMAVLLCLSLTLTSCELPFLSSPSISVTFGSEAAQSVEKGGSVTAPDYTPADDLQVFLGWSTAEGKTSSSDVMFAKGASISYDKLAELATENALKLHPVLSTKKTIALTWNGSGENKTSATLVEGDATSATAPEVSVGAKQAFLGWATTADATEAALAPDAIVNFASVSSLAADGALTLYPVVKTYDLVVGVVNVSFDLEDEEGNVIHDVYYYVGLVEADFAAAHPDAAVLYRVYDGSVAECGAQIREDGDVDVVMAGNNIDDPEKGNLTVIAKAKLTKDYNPDNSRRGALLVNSELALDMYAMLIGAENKNVEVTLNGTATVVNSALGNKVDTSSAADPSGRVIIGWARTENATVIEIEGETLNYSTVSALAENGKITLYPVYGEFDLIVGVITYGFKDDANNLDVNYFVGLVKADFAEKHPDAVIDYRIYQGSVAEAGALINADGDVDVVMAGNNITSTAKVEVIVKAKIVEKYNPDDARRASIVVDSELARELYAMLVGKENANVEVTIGEAKTLVNSLIGNKVDTSAVVAPTGKKLAGWALTADATEALILATTALDYSAVKEHATEGKITLYPVFEDDVRVDLVFDVLLKNITVEEINQLVADFKAYLVASGDTTEYNIVVRTDFDGKGADFLARVKAAGDVDVVLGASNLVEQAGAEIIVQGENSGAYGKLSAVAGSTRCVGMIEGCAHEDLAIKFINFCQTAPAN